MCHHLDGGFHIMTPASSCFPELKVEEEWRKKAAPCEMSPAGSFIWQIPGGIDTWLAKEGPAALLDHTHIRTGHQMHTQTCKTRAGLQVMMLTEHMRGNWTSLHVWGKRETASQGRPTAWVGTEWEASKDILDPGKGTCHVQRPRGHSWKSWLKHDTCWGF